MMPAQMHPDKKCSNCLHGIPVYKRGDVVAWLCRDDMDDIRTGTIMADDLSEVKDCARWTDPEI